MRCPRRALSQTSVQVRRLFATASPYPLKLGAAQQAGDAELVSAQQSRLMAVAVRTMALPLGRGALALGMSEFRALGVRMLGTGFGMH